MKDIEQTKVYFNSACPVCNAGIAYQKTQMKSCEVSWIDVHVNPEAVKALGVELEFVRERLHVVDTTGQVNVGAAALASLWASTPRQKWLGRLAKWPVVRTVAKVSYNAFAKLLYRWNRRFKHW
jgi:predicted DCC family thiol-disulfide oxidoreductase YuxK